MEWARTTVTPNSPGQVHSYFAYGIGIHCDVELPDLPRAKNSADVVVKYGKAEPLHPVASGAKWCIQFKDDEAYFFYDKLGMCRVRKGREIIGEPCEGANEEELGLLAQGPGLSVLLHQRGYVTLHASCVSTAAGAVAFVGKSGSGKSVLAAALHSSGYGLIADDVTVVDADANEPIVYPGYPQCHLMPDAAEYFGYDKKKSAEVKSTQEKIAWAAHKGFPIHPVALRCIYLLHEGPEFRIEPVSRHRALFELVRHSYWIRFVHDARPSSYFLQCGKICGKVPVRTLSRPKSMNMLPELLIMLERDFSAVA
ncbi:MAG: hypothetical protein HY912_00665 [Desulfomonile tiedjei]|uniref:Serine kinase of the HPr protein, regulates carbohydrate metabolism n=1 Tax=Desulfomonile tiedjei TaxID=2358 RepID=A0A9D6Z1R4_9BACT|nr:hypothetical protein [Desulfomonile tiedjei]